MIRWTVLVAGAVAATAAAFVAGASVPAKTDRPMEAKAEVGKPQVVVGQKTGYFNMPKVLRSYKKATTAVQRLNAKKERMAANLMGLRAMHIQLQEMLQKNPNAANKDEITEDLVRLGRQIEDLDRSLSRILNNQASTAIAELHDDLRAVTAAVAKENSLTAMLAYPDAVTPEEAENPLMKEMKLKVPALQPFYLDSSAEYSDEIIRRLNEKFEAENKD